MVIKKKVKSTKKTVARTTKKVTKTPTAKASPKAKKIGKIEKPFTKSELFATIADNVELSRKQVVDVFDNLAEIVAVHIKKGGPEKFMLPGLLKIAVKHVPAKPARDGVNPFTGEPMKFKAKPASKKVKVMPLANLKAMC